MKLAVCRLCLVTDVKMSNLRGPGLKDFIENILKNKGFSKDLDKRNYACYECRALLLKSYNFIQKVTRAQKALYTMETATTTALKSLDRRKLGLLPTLSYHRVEIDYFIEENETQLKSTLGEDAESKVGDLNLLKVTLIKDENECCSTGRVKEEIIEEYATDPFTSASTTYVTVVAPDHSGEADAENNVQECPTYDDLTETKNRAKTSRIRPVGTVISTENIVTGVRKRKAKFFNNTDNESDSENVKVIKKGRKKKDEDYQPHKSSEEEESSSEPEMFDDSGKRIKRPKDKRVFPMQCELCNYDIESRVLHFRHYLICHPNAEYPYSSKTIYICQFCGKAKKTAGHLRDHELVHSKKKTVECPLCPEKFLNSARLRGHKRYYHCDESKLLICDYCNKKIKTRSDLILHIRTHTGEKPFKCHICGEGFAHLGNVGIHIRNVHQKEHLSKKKKK